jgi:radical SAM superfamily enzyme YgiQ (UPF0313 family)
MAPQSTAVLVAYLDQDNLGIGYLAAVLLERGHRPVIVDYRTGPDTILATIQRENPVVVGFSIIFQYFTPHFRKLMGYLRDNGVECHFTAGGHYPSLNYQETLQSTPELNSVVRFEGEYTFLELVERLAGGGEWTSIPGVACRVNGGITEAPLRPLEPDLDNFPIPVRGPVRPERLGQKEATLLAGRGCLYNCSFCSIRQFYSGARGPLKRIRRPEMVAREMELLHQESGCSVFLFQDDDFPGAARTGEAWAARFCGSLRERDLHNRVLWKISCRTDEVEAGRFRLMSDAGLFLVYLGIESGTESGLKLMHKHVGVEANALAVETLRRLGLACEFGFMLFDPLSTMESIRGNLDFLDRICGDGYVPVTACKMIPYGGTAIEEFLRRAGRLKVWGEYEDYDFLDPAVEELYGWFAGTFVEWLQGPEGILSSSRFARYYLAIERRLLESDAACGAVEAEVTEAMVAANRLFTDSIREAAALCEANPGAAGAALDRLRQRVREEETALAAQLRGLIGRIEGRVGCLYPPHPGAASGRSVSGAAGNF